MSFKSNALLAYYNIKQTVYTRPPNKNGEI
jgi:hypothetical protein